MPSILYVLIFLATLLLAESLWRAVGSYRQRALVRRRLPKYTEIPSAEPQESDGSLLRGSAPNGLLDRLASSLPSSSGLNRLIERAGMETSPGRLLGTCFLLATGGWLVGTFGLANPALGIALAGTGAVPWLQVRRRARKRMELFERQFPDALGLLTRALRAGHSLSFGFQMISEELPDPLGTEFGRVAEEVKLGLDINKALANLTERVDVQDLPFFVTAIGIQRETGGNLTEILEKLGHIVRERFKLYGKVRALSAMGRASANLLATWPFVMVGALYFANPDYIKPLWETEAGHSMAMVSAVLVLIGYVICRKMAEIKV